MRGMTTCPGGAEKGEQEQQGCLLLVAWHRLLRGRGRRRGCGELVPRRRARAMG